MDAPGPGFNVVPNPYNDAREILTIMKYLDNHLLNISKNYMEE